MCKVGERQSRPSKCPSSSWVSSCAFRPQPEERPAVSVTRLEGLRRDCGRKRTCPGGWEGLQGAGRVRMSDCTNVCGLCLLHRGRGRPRYGPSTAQEDVAMGVRGSQTVPTWFVRPHTPEGSCLSPGGRRAPCSLLKMIVLLTATSRSQTSQEGADSHCPFC